MSEDVIDVRIVGIPVALHRDVQEHAQALFREFQLILAREPDAAVPARLLGLIDELTARYGNDNEAQSQAVADAAEAGVDSIDLVYSVPVAVAEAVEQLSALMDEADQYCRNGELLTLVSAPLDLAYRRWFLDEFVGQIRHGRVPQAWSDPGPGTEAAAGSGSVGRTGRVVIDQDLDYEGAASVRAQLLAHVEEGATELEVDLRDCTFVDSMGISLLVTVHRRARAGGGRLTLSNMTPAVRKTLDIAGLLSVLDVAG
ncbi:MAG: STAS domain-containing protein [Acidimicrobiia bacterium]